MGLKTWRLYHAKNGGDLDGTNFRGSEVFFADRPVVAETYAEHCCYQDIPSGLAPDEYDEAVLAAAPVVFPVILSLANAALMGRRKLRKIGREVGISEAKLERFADDFEDSGPTERETVFNWLRGKGYDGAILPRDLMPEFVGGDWHLTRSYVAFHPEHQVRFAIGAS
jgi:hypothetical protein